MSPPGRIIAAMPGTLTEIAFRTGYSIEAILKLITLMRRDGTRITAIRDESVTNVPVKAQPEPDALSTIFSAPIDDTTSER